MKTSDGPASGLMPTDMAAGKMMMPARMATQVSMTEIGGVGGEAADADAEGEECLSHGIEEDLGGDLREIGHEEELDALGSTGEGE